MREMEDMEYLVPDYYPSFCCKVGACRTPCCDGWPVTFSMSDYFRLLGLDCSTEIKGQIDRALHLTDRPTEDEYAMILPGYDGRCPLRMADGRCAIHAEKGEDALPAVCRLYPRVVRDGEACCSNSCEAVVEMLRREEPLAFAEIQIEAKAVFRSRVHYYETGGREMRIRLWLIGFVQDRRYRLSGRLIQVGEATRRMEQALNAREGARVEALLSGEETVIAPEVSGGSDEALKMAASLLERLDEVSESIRDLGKAALERFEREGETGMDKARKSLALLCPHWETWFENLIVNHMFFSQYPFQDRPVNLHDEVTALYSVYALLRFMMLGAGDGTMERLVDITAALFRLVDHTAFDRYAVPILNEICGQEDIWKLLVI